MGDPDDPFGLMNDAGRTRIRPTNRSGAAPPAPERPAPGFPLGPGFGAPAAPVRHARAHPNPLVAAFAPLLEIAPELERATAPPSAETLRVRLLDSLVDARDSAVARGVPLARADQAAWFVAALIDDLAINTPWGGHSDWPRQPLVVSLSGDVDAGARFFERLAELQRHPERDPELLELALICLGLGFRGRFRVAGPQADGALLQARMGAARLGGADADRAPLSPRWQGVEARDTPRRFAVPLWAIGVVTLAVVAAIYIALAWQLSQRGAQLYAVARLIPPPERAQIYRPPRGPGETPPPLEPVVLELLPQFVAAAPADTASALSGQEDVSLTTLVVRGTDPEVFRSARADVNAVYLPLIASIGQTIVANAEVIGGVTVTGHTDSVPVQASNPFATNQGLSEARARTIAELLVRAGVPPDLIAVEGRADSEPVGDNATAAGRAQNRRVEIRIGKRL
ncbi:type IVB secretion system protein IcmH/DotU [Paracoccus sp. Z118]|uniref:type IVB secretion system protein IcmH/DotU n=1 Tax=Paracoccus sp. Z118 TaxID=2851017 RepID=UPI001C2BA42E|nr:type IVB secretion system protein IcmH/DotU [Paracoccus sp. Z118]MBV0890898.1 type IVB secretion system protein IcmH/DotU [Paracoccus sp. Z118]